MTKCVDTYSCSKYDVGIELIKDLAVRRQITAENKD